jgi:NAD(P)-dependent dehydrogenase (short-subunit alcohol dehydrogenase family)
MPAPTPQPTALVTGGSAGIGLALAAGLVQDGYRVAILGREAGRLSAAVMEARAELALVCDLREPAAVDAAIASIEKDFGRLDLLVNNAGQGRFLSLAETSEADWDAMIGTNLTGAWRITRRALPLLLASRGALLNIISVAGRQGFASNSAYCASKFGLRGLAEALREELRGQGLRVINVYPGATDTPFWDTVAGDWDRSRMLRPADVAQAARDALRMPAGALVEDLVIGPAGGAL